MSDDGREREIRARLEKATKGPWHHGPYYQSDIHAPTGRVAECGLMRGDAGIADAEFIAHAREDIPYLLDHLTALRETIERQQQALRAMTDGDEAEVSAIVAMAVHLAESPHAAVLLRHVAAQANRLATERAARLQAEEWDAELRRVLWLNHGCPIAGLYGDDGEMQCNARHAPSGLILDFKRDELPYLVSMILSLCRDARKRAEQAEARAAQAERDKAQLDAALKCYADEQQKNRNTVAQLRTALEKAQDYIRTAMKPVSVAAACSEGRYERAHRAGLQHALNAINAEFGKVDALAVSPEGHQAQEP